jgi:Tol biopolymer transport system component
MISKYLLPLITLILSVGILYQCKKKTNNEEIETWKPTASDKIFFSYAAWMGVGNINMIDITGINELISIQGEIIEMEVSNNASKISFNCYWHDTLNLGQIIGHSVLINNKISGGRYADWAYDDSKIAFEKLGFNDRDSMYISKADGTKLSFIGLGRYPQWSPDGNKILFSLGDSIYMANQDGTGRMNIAKGTDPVWTPGGLRIYFYDSDAWWSFDLSNSQINKLFDLQNTTTLYLNTTSCTWSPDRTKLCYRSDDWSLYVKTISGNFPVKVLNVNPESIIYSIDWSPDGTQIAFSWSTKVQENNSIFVVNADGSKVYKVVNLSGECLCVDWR